MISTLPSLRTRSAKEVEGILSSLTLDLLPNPGVSSESRSELTPELRERLLSEIRVNLRLKKTDNSRDSMGKIYGYLAENIQRAVLTGVDVNDVKRRLGQSGDLAPRLYKVEFLKSLSLDENRGIQKGQIEATLQMPDSVEHLSPDSTAEDQKSKATSVYTKVFRNTVRPENTYTLLVFCMRSGYVQKVQHAWYVFHSEVNLSIAKTALDVLKAFVDRYGIELHIGDKKGKLFFYERVQLKGDGETETELIKLQRGIPTGTLNFQIGSIKDSAVMVFWAFGISYKDYDAMLGRHGIKIKKGNLTEPQQVTSVMIQKVGSETKLNIRMDSTGT